MIRLQFKERATQRKWQNGMTMHDCKGAMNNMFQSAKAIAAQDGWAAWRIVDDSTGRLLYGVVEVMK